MIEILLDRPVEKVHFMNYRRGNEQDSRRSCWALPAIEEFNSVQFRKERIM